MRIALYLLESDLRMLVNEVGMRGWTIVAIEGRWNHATSSQLALLGNKELVKISGMIFREIKAFAFSMSLGAFDEHLLPIRCSRIEVSLERIHFPFDWSHSSSSIHISHDEFDSILIVATK